MEATARDHPDIFGAGKIARAESFKAITPSGHLFRLSMETRREILGRGEVRLTGGLIQEEDPGGVQAEQSGYFCKCALEQRAKIHRTVQSSRDGIEDGELVAPARQLLAVLIGIVHSVAIDRLIVNQYIQSMMAI